MLATPAWAVRAPSIPVVAQQAQQGQEQVDDILHDRHALSHHLS
jgi:hypothetical protein